MSREMEDTPSSLTAAHITCLLELLDLICVLLLIRWLDSVDCLVTILGHIL